MADDRIPGIDPTARPSGTGCAECLAGDGPGWWMHLRRCAECGHIGCCDSSPAQHGTRHAVESGHPYLTSFEPGEDWFWNVRTEQYYEGGPQLAEPTAHPLAQPVPGPAGAVPADWERHLH
ncbi:UBP-type zinc finger domain-containing protein [Streptomyces wuyuanensis]|uniref:Ubiquitin-hydrolase Zn-finger-containing protein n=1 Tax=Streptomyces wuyuanensis TaxID=1196353 RepID=A0A1G9TR25_9ACTN|nr:UBP-type zinc finger domain-containing protein [Streptomyces wuyuanensis]SDM49874.1 ubiquitin-hydrolase Zn-finger-containing protein [Streptomyces wuyuanensis]